MKDNGRKDGKDGKSNKDPGAKRKVPIVLLPNALTPAGNGVEVYGLDGTLTIHRKVGDMQITGTIDNSFTVSWPTEDGVTCEVNTGCYILIAE